MNDKMIDLCRKRDAVVILRGVAEDEACCRLLRLIGSDIEKPDEYVSDYCDFVAALYRENTSNLSEHLLKVILEDENICIVQAAKGKTPEPEMREALIHELKFFQELSQLTPEDLTDGLDFDGFLPKWTISDVDFAGSYNERLSLAGNFGYGKWAKSCMFIYRDGKIEPVMKHDRQKLSELFGYEKERRAVIDNTLALIEGRPAQNVLLYGDAGTGKSSTVKAVVNEYRERGLRLIEITKEQLRDIPAIIDEISDIPLRFILFTDDLSFTSGEDCFGALKAMLEGSAAAKASNTVIYATSNRRHLIRESFSDREGDDVHRNDSMQEMLSLSARFGLRVNFSRPDKNEYTSIVKELAEMNGIVLDEKELSLKAEQFAMASGNGRSPRTAKQFVASLVSGNN